MRINWLEVQGFRAFGTETQRVELTGPVAAVWASNSTGKTSLAEALEFLLTGATVRRELMASGKDEFSESLRNVHMPTSVPCFVRGELVDDGGQPHLVTRTLRADYAKKASCESDLEIDGNPAGESQLAGLGLKLSQPPLAAPILMQHTLGYVLSASPQDRALYFKALLEVTDLDELAADVGKALALVGEHTSPVFERFAAAAQLPALRAALGPLLGRCFSSSELADALSAAAAAILSSAGESAPADPAARFARVRTLLDERRSKTFPLQHLKRLSAPTWTPPPSDVWAPVDTFRAETRDVDEQLKQLLPLFHAALAIPDVAQADLPIDCPLCATPNGLTPERIREIREALQQTEAYQSAQRAAGQAVSQVSATLTAATTGAPATLPPAARWSEDERLARGVGAENMRALLPAEAHPFIDAWGEVTSKLSEAVVRLEERTANARTALAPLVKDPASAETDPKTIAGAVEGVREAHAEFRGASETLDKAETALVDAIRAVVDVQSNTEGWQDLVDLVGQEGAIATAALEKEAAEALAKDFSRAVKDVDRAKGVVLGQRFQHLSAEVETWWNLLRPGEPTFFSKLAPRPNTRRTIDFKAGLSTDASRSTVATRDAIAVFSFSQLHCLGLAAFLARAVRENTGFVVLDDPVLSSDEDHWPTFTSDVVQRLMDAGIQTIVLTQDWKIRVDLDLRYRHAGIDNFRLTREDPVKGAHVVKTSDEIEELLDRAGSLIGNTNPDIRKQGSGHLRIATERFCKEILVRDRHAKGDAAAAIADYDGKMLGELRPKAQPLLNKDPSHPGRLHAIEKVLNPGSHHAQVPSAGELKVAAGDLKYFKKEYL